MTISQTENSWKGDNHENHSRFKAHVWTDYGWKFLVSFLTKRGRLSFEKPYLVPWAFFICRDLTIFSFFASMTCVLFKIKETTESEQTIFFLLFRVISPTIPFNLIFQIEKSCLSRPNLYSRLYGSAFLCLWHGISIEGPIPSHAIPAFMVIAMSVAFFISPKSCKASLFHFGNLF